MTFTAICPLLHNFYDYREGLEEAIVDSTFVNVDCAMIASYQLI